MTRDAAGSIDIRFRLASAKSGDALKSRIQRKLDRSIGHWSDVIQHVDVRFEDHNGPRGGTAMACSVTIALQGAEPIVVKSRDTTQSKAFALVVPKLERTLRRNLGKRDITVGRRARKAASRQPALAGAPSLIGRREGRGTLQQRVVLARPEKRRRDLFTDTSLPGVSETDRKAGGGHSARRNTRKGSSKMTVTLEDSLGKPSKKSTRRSKGGGKPSHGKERAAVAKSMTPKARSQRG